LVVAFRRVFVLGGARSGKSTFAERLALDAGGHVLYFATATADDEEMAERIRLHQARRPPSWRTLETPTDIAARATSELVRFRDRLGPSGASDATITVLVEDLTLLLANLMALADAAAERRTTTEVDSLVALEANVILVSNEVGMGVVPPYPSGRLFRDMLGRVNQHAAAASNEVYVMFAGVPLKAK
jgi:adenosylcobinamide kinase/adenosylcobinamide-phosphate guanylyltransferase